MRKFGGLQNESRELSTKAGKLQEELKKVSAERDELKFLLEATQAQAKVYEEDFKTERDDRTRAFAEREKEGERYREEIERLQIQLKSHKGNLTDLEIIHMARQRELMQAMDDLKKCQEEVQAKTSQVKQYKKQHDGLVTKVATLEREKKELAEQFEMARQQVEQRSKKKAKAAHAEGEQAHAELAKQANHYRAKSQARKAELAKMTAAYAKARQELLNVKKEVKKEKKKTAVISNPVNQSELHELCRNLQFDKEELKDQIKALMETNPKLYESWSALEDADTGSVGSPTELEFPPSPDDEASNSLAVASEVSTRFSSTTKSTGSRPRSSTFSGISHSPKPAGGKKPTPHYSNIPGATTSVRTDIQHADYVNQSRIQAMLANYQQSDAVPASPPDANSLPAPIMVFTEDSANQRKSKLSSVPGSMPPSGASGVGSVVGGGLGGGGVEGQGRERRGSAPTWGSNDPDNLPALHDRQHQLQSNPYGHASLPRTQ
ncbi:hypothetical protein GBAR_LOCUS4384 [Geodia barretti]|uniref:Uncharacterized protein n=1 Tax=Geodia barretti TaxID=519541 RepID=A0AA35W339_GEOBA|nr:hypothetical protein GBAR_LOCUS4384 [Geodia barretti]